ncbi:MAG: hypothetical protein AB7G28_04065 [Pirellulales bacterium]
MQVSGPHFLLFTDADGRSCESAKWRFVLQPIGGGERIVAADSEHDADDMRLALLAVVRGLEALDAPSRVTLLVANRFVRRGIRRDLAFWKERGWRWERFGQLVPIRDLDLWKRIDRALAIHDVECFAWSATDQECDAARSIAPSCGVASDVASDLAEEPSTGVPYRTYPQRRQQVAAAQQLTLWGQEMLQTLSGIRGTALSRTA